jgi:hypothetical protein
MDLLIPSPADVGVRVTFYRKANYWSPFAMVERLYARISRVLPRSADSRLQTIADGSRITPKRFVSESVPGNLLQNTALCIRP